MLAFHFSALSVKTLFSLCSSPLIKRFTSHPTTAVPPFPLIKKLEAVGNKVKELTFHSAPAAGRNVAVKYVCLMSVDSALGMELMKKSSKRAGSTFWQLVVRQEPWDVLQEPGPAAAALGGRCQEAPAAKILLVSGPCSSDEAVQGTVERCL